MNVAHREVNGVPVVAKANIIICRHMSGWRIGFGGEPEAYNIKICHLLDAEPDEGLKSRLDSSRPAFHSGGIKPVD